MVCLFENGYRSRQDASYLEQAIKNEPLNYRRFFVAILRQILPFKAKPYHILKGIRSRI